MSQQPNKCPACAGKDKVCRLPQAFAKAQQPKTPAAIRLQRKLGWGF